MWAQSFSVRETGDGLLDIETIRMEHTSIPGYVPSVIKASPRTNANFFKIDYCS